MFRSWFGGISGIVLGGIFVVGLGLLLGPRRVAVLACFYYPSASHFGTGLSQDCACGCLGCWAWLLGWPFNHFFTIKKGVNRKWRFSCKLVDCFGVFGWWWVWFLFSLVLNCGLGGRGGMLG